MTTPTKSLESNSFSRRENSFGSNLMSESGSKLIQKCLSEVDETITKRRLELAEFQRSGGYKSSHKLKTRRTDLSELIEKSILMHEKSTSTSPNRMQYSSQSTPQHRLEFMQHYKDENEEEATDNTCVSKTLQFSEFWNKECNSNNDNNDKIKGGIMHKRSNDLHIKLEEEEEDEEEEEVVVINGVSPLTVHCGIYDKDKAVFGSNGCTNPSNCTDEPDKRKVTGVEIDSVSAVSNNTSRILMNGLQYHGPCNDKNTATNTSSNNTNSHSSNNLTNHLLDALLLHHTNSINSNCAYCGKSSSANNGSAKSEYNSLLHHLRVSMAKNELLQRKIKQIEAQVELSYTTVSERSRIFTLDRNKLETEKAALEDELVSTKEELLFIRAQLQSKSGKISELEINLLNAQRQQISSMIVMRRKEEQDIVSSNRNTAIAAALPLSFATAGHRRDENIDRPDYNHYSINNNSGSVFGDIDDVEAMRSSSNNNNINSNSFEESNYAEGSNQHSNGTTYNGADKNQTVINNGNTDFYYSNHSSHGRYVETTTSTSTTTILSSVDDKDTLSSSSLSREVLTTPVVVRNSWRRRGRKENSNSTNDNEFDKKVCDIETEIEEEEDSDYYTYTHTDEKLQASTPDITTTSSSSTSAAATSSSLRGGGEVRSMNNNNNNNNAAMLALASMTTTPTPSLSASSFYDSYGGGDSNGYGSGTSRASSTGPSMVGSMFSAEEYAEAVNENMMLASYLEESMAERGRLTSHAAELEDKLYAAEQQVFQYEVKSAGLELQLLSKAWESGNSADVEGGGSTAADMNQKQANGCVLPFPSSLPDITDETAEETYLSNGKHGYHANNRDGRNSSSKNIDDNMHATVVSNMAFNSSFRRVPRDGHACMLIVIAVLLIIIWALIIICALIYMRVMELQYGISLGDNRNNNNQYTYAYESNNNDSINSSKNMHDTFFQPIYLLYNNLKSSSIGNDWSSFIIMSNTICIQLLNKSSYYFCGIFDSIKMVCEISYDRIVNAFNTYVSNSSCKLNWLMILDTSQQFRDNLASNINNNYFLINYSNYMNSCLNDSSSSNNICIGDCIANTIFNNSYITEFQSFGYSVCVTYPPCTTVIEYLRTQYINIIDTGNLLGEMAAIFIQWCVRRIVILVQSALEN